MSITTLKIKELADKKNYSIRQFELACDLKEGVLKMAIRNNGSISSDNLAKILTAFPDVNPSWLLTGAEPMLLGETASVTQIEVPSVSEWNVMIMESRASAGLLSNAIQIRELDGERIHIPRLPKSDVPYIGLYVEGDSMSPDYNNGDLIVCRRLTDEREFRSDKVYVVVTHSDVLLKHVRKIQDLTDPNNGKLQLNSVNKAKFEPQYLYFGDDSMYQLYTLVAHCRYFT